MPKLKATRALLSEPPAKVRRTTRRPKSKTTKTERSQMKLTDLPQEVLEKIFSYINIWHHNRIRGTSRRMRDANDTYVMHRFMKALFYHTTRDSTSYESAALRIIKQATEVYVRSGFISTFCGCILPMLRSTPNDPFCPQVLKINKFLMHFYRMVEQLIGNECSQFSRVLYSVTLMRFFKQFTKSTVLVSQALPLHWRVAVELKGPWLGVMWTARLDSGDLPEKRTTLLLILSEMLLASITTKSFKRVWECPNEIYVFGNDMSTHKRIPRTIFTFTVYGSKKIREMFRGCLENNADAFVWPQKWPKDQFTVNMDIECKEATKWGCSKSQHLEISPFLSIDNNEDEEYDYNADDVDSVLVMQNVF